MKSRSTMATFCSHSDWNERSIIEQGGLGDVVVCYSARMSITLNSVRFVLIDLDHQLVNSWRAAFDDCPNVEARQGSILPVQTSAIVSPANSFGFMDGGLDLALSKHFGWQMETNVRDVLLAEHDGELPVGQAIVVPSGHAQVPWLISAPTMRVPMVVADTTNAYLAFRAILRAVRDHNAERPDDQITSVACPGLGTGNGLMPPDRCARQMRYAYEVCVHGELMRKGGLAAAARNHMRLVDYDSDEQ